MAQIATGIEMAGRPLVVKIGGSTLGSNDTTLQDLVYLQAQGVPVVVVHGGGSIISQWMEKQGAVPRFIRGLRVTDAHSLEIVVAVLAGLVNKQLVASLNAMGGRAIGLSGVDGDLLQARISDPEMGYVGSITKVNPGVLFDALQSHYLPVVAPIGYCCDGSTGAPFTMLNINGDTAAGELALAIEAERLIFLTDVSGVMDGDGRVISRLPARQSRMLLETGAIRGGMIPKVQACLRALGAVPAADIVDGRKPGVLLQCVEGQAVGTRLQL